jgi:hypothetical protein
MGSPDARGGRWYDVLVVFCLRLLLVATRKMERKGRMANSRRGVAGTSCHG